MKTAADFVPNATTRSETGIDIAVAPDQVWAALMALTFKDLWVTAPLMAVRSFPSMLARKGALSTKGQTQAQPVLEAMVGGRFVELHRDAPSILTLGLIGQFWKLSGGVDAAVAGPDAFDEPGYVKTAMDFTISTHRDGTRVTTTTKNMTTDRHAAKMFGRYWRVVGPGSKVIRLDMLRALKRQAER